MKVHLLFADRDADVAATPVDGAEDLIADLDLDPVLEVMQPDKRLSKLCPAVLLNPLSDPVQIAWRQHILTDALTDPSSMRGLFELAGRALESQNSIWMFAGRTADSLLSRSIRGLQALLPSLHELATFATQHLPGARSEGLSELYRRLVGELDPTYLAQMAELVSQLEFPQGVVSRARLDESGLLGSLELLAPDTARRPWWSRLGIFPPGALRFTIAERDEAGAKAIGAMREHAIHDVAATVGRALDHVIGFFRQLHWEAGFYVGAIQLHELLTQLGVPTCWPVPAAEPLTLTATELCCLSLAVRSGTRPVPNDLAGPSVDLCILTGANQGGKTTFLRSIGCAQLLLQAGLFVPAHAYQCGLAPAVHSHFRRAEDDDLASGKLEEELLRMSRIVEGCRPGDLLLMNESFASTDEVEGTYIAADILDALLGHGVRILLVTHFHLLARHYQDRPGTTFLMAERREDGTRSHRLLTGRPASSHGRDIYHQVFGPDPAWTRHAGTNLGRQPTDPQQRERIKT